MKFKAWHIALFIVLMAVLRVLLADVANFAPVAAIGVFAAYYLKSFWKAGLIAVAALLLSDVFLELTRDGMLYWGRLFDYAAVLAAVAVVVAIFKRYRKPGHIALSVLVGSLLFFVVSNFGVWLGSTMYAKSLAGLAQCFYMAIPFYKGTLIGDLVFSGAFFVAVEFYQQRLTSKQKLKA